MTDKTNNPFRAELGGEQVDSSSETALEVDNLSHWFDDFRVLNQVNLTIAPGQIVALVGPSEKKASLGHVILKDLFLFCT